MIIRENIKFTSPHLIQCFEGSQALNQMRLEISSFVAMFVKPFTAETLGEAEWELAPQNIFIPLDQPGKSPVILCAFNGSRIILRVYDRDNNIYQLHQNQEVPFHLVEPVWRGLPEVLKFLCEVPRIKHTAEDYRDIGIRFKSIRTIDTQRP